ncbi:MAG: acyl-CoA dehydrogenase [Anaerolineaceae bacterium]|nr:MAG: acyl-CoA dehydrogenase [Anaerolineaceae bacterium]
MVSFTPTEDQQLLVDTIRRYADKNIRPAAHDVDEAEAPDMDVIQAGWQLGLIPSALPEELGGFGDMSAISGAMIAEELAFGDLSVAMHLLAPSLLAYPVTLFGTAAQRESLLPAFLEEEFTAATAAFLEPGMMFDPRAMQTTATPSGDGVKLNGVKACVPLADESRALLVYARNAESGDIEAYIVPDDTPGLLIQEREKLMGLRALPTFRVKFEDAQVPVSAKLGGAVGIDIQTILNRQNVALGALAVGVARAAFEYAREYAKERVQFGKAIAQNQSIAFMLAEMAIEVDATRLMVWESAWMLDQGQDATREAYLARQYADKMVLTVTDSGVQTLGGYGFIREYPAERWLRNGRGFPTFDGLAIL